MGKRGKKPADKLVKSGNTRTTRTIADQEYHKAVIAEHYLKGKPISHLAKILGVSTTTISRDLDEVRQEWFDQSIRSVAEQRAMELQRLSLVELAAWEAWEGSVGKKVKRTITRKPGKKSSNAKTKLSDIETELSTIETIITEEREEQGDPRYLEKVLACIQKRADLLGMDQMPMGWKPPEVHQANILNINANSKDDLIGAINEIRKRKAEILKRIDNPGPAGPVSGRAG